MNHWQGLADRIGEYSDFQCKEAGCDVDNQEHKCGEGYAYITESGHLLDLCSSDYFQGHGKPHAAIPLPWHGTGDELKEEVENEIAETDG